MASNTVKRVNFPLSEFFNISCSHIDARASILLGILTGDAKYHMMFTSVAPRCKSMHLIKEPHGRSQVPHDVFLVITLTEVVAYIIYQ
jgi:hypothetical protein